MSNDKSKVILLFARAAADSLHSKETPEQWRDRLLALRVTFLEEVDTRIDAANDEVQK